MSNELNDKSSNYNKSEDGDSSAQTKKGDNTTDWHTGYIQGHTFSNKEVKFRLHNGRALFEGDIILADTPIGIEHLGHRKVKGVGIRGDMYRWSRGEIPYIIKSDIPNQNRITDAIRHWENNTPIRFIYRTDSNANYYPNYVSFDRYMPGPNESHEETFHCSAMVGMQGNGHQSVTVSDQCGVGDIIHEIGHAAGLWHEQSRNDRKNYVEVLIQNVETEPYDMTHNFDQHVTDGDDIGTYDYCSIMHYGAYFFSKNGQPTLRVLRRDLPCGNEDSLGQKNGLSSGDVNTITHLYAPYDPTVILNSADGRLELFMVNYSDKLIYHRKQGAPTSNSNGWDTPWAQIGLQTSIPSNTRPSINRTTLTGLLEVFWGANGNIWTAHQDTSNGSFSAIEYGLTYVYHFGNSVMGRDADGRLEVFFVSGDDPCQLYHFQQRSLSDPNMNLLNPLGGNWSPNRRPVVANNSDGRLDVFMIGLDSQLNHKWQTSTADSSQWSNDWVSIGKGPFIGDPVVSFNARNGLEVFAISRDGLLKHTWQMYFTPTSSQWSEWNTIPTSGGWLSNVRPTVAQNADGRIELCIVDNNGILWHISQTSPSDSSQWSAWDQLFGNRRFPTNAKPVLIRNADGRLEVFIVGSDEQIYHNWQILFGGKLQWNSTDGIQL